MDIVAGDPNLSTPFAELSRVPANPDARTVSDLDHVYPYEDWFDHYVANKKFVAMVSFGPMATLNHGLEASDVKVCLFAQGWAMGEIEWYEGSKNTMPCPESAKALSERAWVAVVLTDEAFYTAESLSFAYEGDTIEDCIETYESFHGGLDSTVVDQLVESARKGPTHRSTIVSVPWSCPTLRRKRYFLTLCPSGPWAPPWRFGPWTTTAST